MKAPLVTAASVLVLALLAWLLLGRGGARPGPAEAALVEPAVEDAAPVAPLAPVETERVALAAPTMEPEPAPTRPAESPAPAPALAGEPAYVLHGRVHDEVDVGLEGAQVFAMLSKGRRVTRTGRDGLYRFELTRDEAHALIGLAARHERALPTGKTLVFHGEARVRHELACDLLMPAACMLSVTVVDEDGAPVEGALVRVSDMAKNWGGGGAANREVWERQALLRTTHGSRVAFSEAGADGVCRLDDAPCEPRMVDAWHPGFIQRDSVRDSELEVLGRDAVRIVLVRAVPIEGLVQDEEGRPVPGATVQLVRNQVAGEARTDAEGRFLVSGFPRDVAALTLLVRAEGFDPLLEARWTPPADGPAVLTLTAGSELELLLTDADTGLVVEGRVALRFALHGRFNHVPVEEQLERRATSDEGRVVLHGFPAFADALEVDVDGYDPSLVSFAPGPPEGVVPVRLTRPRTLLFRCVDDDTGEPVPTWTATFFFERDHRDGEQTKSSMSLPFDSTSDGLVMFLPSRLVPDDVPGFLYVEAQGYEPLRLDGDRATLAVGETTVLRLRPLQR